MFCYVARFNDLLFTKIIQYLSCGSSSKLIDVVSKNPSHSEYCRIRWIGILNIDRELTTYLNKKINSKNDFLDFRAEKTNYATHGYHDYPATMIPQLPKLFIEAVEKFKKIDSVYDPFAGSGTTLVEARLHGLNSVGVDLNPLAILMNNVKTKLLDSAQLETIKEKLYQDILLDRELFRHGKNDLIYPIFKNIDYWFKDYVIIDLQIIKNQIMKITSKDMRDFFLLAFSATTRFVSNTRNNEFKMYRMAPEKLEKWNPDVFKKFCEFTEMRYMCI